jgi:hypothetical protein
LLLSIVELTILTIHAGHGIEENQFGVMYVGNRLKYKSLSFDLKHQMVLPPKHLFTAALIHAFHLEILHAGPNLTMATLQRGHVSLASKSTPRPRPNFWPNFRVENDNLSLLSTLVSTTPDLSTPDLSTPDLSTPDLSTPDSGTRGPQGLHLSVFMRCRHGSTPGIVRGPHHRLVLGRSRPFYQPRGKLALILSDNGTNLVEAG